MSAPIPPPRGSAADEAVATIIPYRNTPALIAYYLGVFSLIPCIGALLALGSVPLGIWGLSLARSNPQAHGKAHAWVGVIAGTVVLIAHAVFFGLMVLGR